MKYHIAFLAGLLVALGIFSYFILSPRENRFFYFSEDKENVTQIIHRFQQDYDARLTINFSALYGRRGQLQILHPMLDVSNLQIENIRHLCDKSAEPALKTSGFNAACKPASHLLESDSESSRDKLYFLYRALYEKADLPQSFFARPPFLDEEGNSYAYVLVRRGSSPFNEKSWIEQHLSYFKVSELKEVLTTHQIAEPTYNLIAELSDSEIERVVKGETLILTPRYLLLKDQSRYGFSPLSYLVYDLTIFQNAIKGGNYELVSQSADTYCIEKVGNACWTYSSKYTLTYLYKYSVFIFVVLGVVFLTVIALYFKRLYDKNRERQKHRLSLQVLSHEFRTPVSSILLMIDQLRSASVKLDISDQDLITRISAEVFRLQRIVEVSKTYLQAEGGGVRFNPVKILSVNQWIEDFVTDSNLNIHFNYLENDQSISADPFWLKFILSSLVQNAFVHGAEPVCIHLDVNKGSLGISVRDAGNCEYDSLEAMTEAFAKSQKSKGMGLGLNIVKYIVDDWGGEIRFSKDPTSFTLFLAACVLKDG